DRADRGGARCSCRARARPAGCARPGARAATFAMSVAGDTAPPIPDAITPIIAYRTWAYDLTTRDASLRSVGVRSTWETHGWTRAACIRTRHPAPEEGCTCGIYALRSMAQAMASAVAWFLPDRGQGNL